MLQTQNIRNTHRETITKLFSDENSTEKTKLDIDNLEKEPPVIKFETEKSIAYVKTIKSITSYGTIVAKLRKILLYIIMNHLEVYLLPEIPDK